MSLEANFCGQMQNPRFSGLLLPTYTVTSVAAEDAATYTAAQVLGGLIIRDCAGADRSDVMPTAVALLALIPTKSVGAGFEFTIRNASDGDPVEAITVTGGTGCTVTGTATIAQGSSKRFKVVFSGVSEGSEAYVCYSLGTLVH